MLIVSILNSKESKFIQIIYSDIMTRRGVFLPMILNPIHSFSMKSQLSTLKNWDLLGISLKIINLLINKSNLYTHEQWLNVMKGPSISFLEELIFIMDYFSISGNDMAGGDGSLIESECIKIFISLLNSSPNSSATAFKSFIFGYGLPTIKSVILALTTGDKADLNFWLAIINNLSLVPCGNLVGLGLLRNID